MRIVNLLVATLMLSAPSAFAGVTIHFKGAAIDDASVDRISEVACEVAVKNSWRCQRIAGEDLAKVDGITAKSIAQIEGSSDFSKVKGAVVFMHEMSEPLYLVFGQSRRTDNFVKTQFAGADVHVHAVELLEKIKPFFATLEVLDEGGYWESKDRAKLEQELASVQTLMLKVKREHPEARGPVKRADGRILDLVGK